MANSNIQISIISTRSALIIFGIASILTGADYFYFAKQIKLLFPNFLDHVFVVYLFALAFVLAGIAILIDKRITTLASFLFAMMFFGLAVIIDLRGIFNKDDDLKFLFVQSFFKDFGVIAGAIIIANIEREKSSHKHGRRRRHRTNKDVFPQTPQ
jgi:hypothetical protein